MSPLIVVSFALIASLVVPLFPVQYSPSTQNEHRVVQNRAFDYRLLLVASSCRNPLTDEVHSVRSQGRSARHRSQDTSTLASPLGGNGSQKGSQRGSQKGDQSMGG